MSALDATVLGVMEARAQRGYTYHDDVPTLIAEVRRLQSQAAHASYAEDTLRQVWDALQWAPESEHVARAKTIMAHYKKLEVPQ